MSEEEVVREERSICKFVNSLRLSSAFSLIFLKTFYIILIINYQSYGKQHLTNTLSVKTCSLFTFYSFSSADSVVIYYLVHEA